MKTMGFQPGKPKVLGRDFFNRPVLKVAEDLLGKYLVRRIGQKIVAQQITEVEAYDGPADLASHASKGRTKRTEPMFGHAGRFYVYLCYGVYWMLNIVTGEKDYPAAILIRGAGDYNGPGKVTKNLRIDKSLNAKKAVPANGLWFEDRGFKIAKSRIKKTSRVGVAYAGPVWAGKKYRFILPA
jgi:DNA-3-methyladenine glycosylase